MQPRVFFCTFGSRGDLHPSIAIALALKDLGIESTIGTGDEHAETIARAGLRHAPIPPHRRDFDHIPDMMTRAMSRTNGGEYIFRELLLPNLSRVYEETLEAARDSSLIVGHPLAIAAPIVAEKLHLPYVFTAPQSLGFLSADDPPVLPVMWWLRHLRPLGAWPFRLLWAMGNRRIAGWAGPVHELRRSLSLPRARGNPLLAGLWSDTLNLGLFSPVLSPPAPDWPPNTVAVGPCLYDDPGAQSEPDARLQAFLAATSPDDKPILFTLGSAAVEIAGDFYRHAVEAATKLGRRSVLLVGKGAIPERAYGDRHLAVGYAPYSRVMPHCCAVVHQCGSGTTHEVLRAGVPQVCVPFAHDQPDYAFRVQRAGLGVVVAQPQCSARTLARALQIVLDPPTGYLSAAASAGALARQEHGAATAAREIARVLSTADVRSRG